MWTVRRRGRAPKGAESDWEVEQERERRRHAAWLYEHGAPVGEVVAETGLRPHDVRAYMGRDAG